MSLSLHVIDQVDDMWEDKSSQIYIYVSLCMSLTWSMPCWGIQSSQIYLPLHVIDLVNAMSGCQVDAMETETNMWAVDEMERDYITCEVTPFTYHRPGRWHVQQAKCIPSLSHDYHPALTDLTHFAIISHSHSSTYGCIHQRLPHSILWQPLPTLALWHLCVPIPQMYLAPRVSISCKSFFVVLSPPQYSILITGKWKIRGK